MCLLEWSRCQRPQGTHGLWCTFVTLSVCSHHTVASDTGLTSALWADSREEDFCPQAGSNSCSRFSKYTSVPSPQWVLPFLEAKICPRSTVRSSLSCDSASDSDVISCHQACLNLSFYLLCQELILSSCFPASINNLFFPQRPHRIEAALCHVLTQSILLTFSTCLTSSFFSFIPVRFCSLRSREVRVKTIHESAERCPSGNGVLYFLDLSQRFSSSSANLAHIGFFWCLCVCVCVCFRVRI